MEERDHVKFLGTAGARFMMVRQLRATGGVWYSVAGLQFLLDPGPGSVVRCAASRPRLDPLTLDAIVLSHAHLDHSNDVNVMIEAMTNGGFTKRGRLFCPRQALEGEDPVVLRYLRSYLDEIVVLEEGGSYELKPGLRLRTPIRHRHPAETYGLMLETPRLKVAHVTDTLYFPELAQAYAGADVLIVHVVRLRKAENDTRDIQHFTLDDARRLIEEVRPRRAILTHFGMTMHRAKPWLLAEQLAKETGIEVHAASDGATFQL
jgi:ribonuclease BN (tRNA processing enzyme)